MEKRFRAGLWIKLLLNLGVLAVCVTIFVLQLNGREKIEPVPQPQGVQLGAETTVKRSYYAQCGHILSAPGAVSNRIYDNWCPQHLVVKIYGETLGVYRPDGGDGLIQERALQVRISELSNDFVSELEHGIAFDSIEDVEHALEDAGS